MADRPAARQLIRLGAVASGTVVADAYGMSIGAASTVFRSDLAQLVEYCRDKSDAAELLERSIEALTTTNENHQANIKRLMADVEYWRQQYMGTLVS